MKSLLDELQRVIKICGINVPIEVQDNVKYILDKYPSHFNSKNYSVYIRTNGVVTISSLDDIDEIDVGKKHISVRLITEITKEGAIREISDRHIEFNEENLEKVVNFIAEFRDKKK